MANTEMRYAELHLGYFKQGDDMAGCLKKCRDQIVAALRLRADGLEAAIKYLRELAQAIADTGRSAEFHMDADTHMIQISGPRELVDLLIEKKLLDEDPFESDHNAERAFEGEQEEEDN